MYPPPHPRYVSTTGPKVLTFSGIALLLVGIVGIVVAIATLIGNLPVNIITPQGQPGRDALAGITASDELQFDSPGDSSYDLWEVQHGHNDQQVFSREGVAVTGPDGSAVLVRNAEVSGSIRLGAYTGETFASFRAQQGGTYTIVLTPLPGTHPPGANGSASGGNAPVDAVLTQGSEFPSFFAGLFTTVGAMILGIGGLLVGGGMTIGGIIWWVMANGRRKRAAAAAPR